MSLISIDEGWRREATDTSVSVEVTQQQRTATDDDDIGTLVERS